jgi:rhodanese-related sulfurtransferase
MVYQISVDDLKARQDKGDSVVLIDVRQPWENDTVRLADSILIPLNELPQRTDEIPQKDDTLIIVYCHHGVRSLSGAAIIEGARIKNVASLAGGIDRWAIAIDPTLPRY